MINGQVLKKIAALLPLFSKRERRYRKVRLPFKSSEDLCQLPVMTRADLKAFVNAGPIAGAFNITATSGSTGSRLLIAHSRAAYESHLRRLVRIYRSVGGGAGDLCLNLCSYELNSGGRLMEAAYKAAGVGVIPLGGVSIPQRLNEAVALVKALRPTMINAYTNQLFDIFSKLGTKHSIKTCVVNGEPLWPAYRERIERLGGVRVHDHYGAMEVSGFAIAQDPDDPFMKVFPDGLLCEVMGDDGCVSREGIGSLLVTDLENTCMPFIRYQLGDRVELIRRKGAWRVRVLSRTEDSILVNGVVLMKSLILRAANDFLGHPNFFFEVHKDIATYKDTLFVNIPAADINVTGRMAGILASVSGLDQCIVIRSFRGDIPRTVSGKIRYFIDACATDG